MQTTSRYWYFKPQLKAMIPDNPPREKLTINTILFQMVTKQMTFQSRLKTCFLFQLGFVLLLTGTLPLTGNTASSEMAKTVAKRQAETTPSVTMTIENISISRAAAQIGKQTGYRIKLEGLAPDLPVAGRFIEIDLTTVLTRLLREYNLGIVFDHTARQVTVKSLGKKPKPKFQNTHITKYNHTDLPQELNQELREEDTLNYSYSADDDRDPFTGQTNEEIANLHREQSAEIDRELENPNTIDTLTGMTYAEIKELHDSQ